MWGKNIMSLCAVPSPSRQGVRDIGMSPRWECSLPSLDWVVSARRLHCQVATSPFVTSVLSFAAMLTSWVSIIPLPTNFSIHYEFLFETVIPVVLPSDIFL